MLRAYRRENDGRHSKVCQVTYVDQKVDKIVLNIIVGMKLVVLMNLGTYLPKK